MLLNGVAYIITLFFLLYHVYSRRPISSLFTETTVVILGNDSTFQRHCTYSGSVTPFQLRWLRDGSIVREESQGVRTSNLRIHPVERRDQGEYTCQVVSQDRVVLDINMGKLAVYDPGTALNAPPVQMVDKGGRIRLRCSSNIPDTFVYWVIPEGSSSSKFGLIQEAKTTDQEMYLCNVINYRGKIIHSLHIRLRVNGTTSNAIISNRCGNPVNIPNGKVRISENGNRATYSCHMYFNLIGTATQICENEVWSGSQPNCDAVVCPALSIANGNVMFTNATLGGSVATFECNALHYLNGPTNSICQQSGTWSATGTVCQMERPRIIVCPLIRIVNGAVSYTEETNIGSIAIVACRRQFALRGPRTRECQNSGLWTGEDPVCQPRTTGNLICPVFTIVNGEVTFTDHTNIGSVAHIACDEQHVLRGSNTRECEISGEWTYEEPVCLHETAGTTVCPVLNVLNGVVVYTDGSNSGSVAVITCNSQYELHGSNSRECLSSGEWTENDPVCLPHPSGSRECPLLTIMNGAVVYTDGNNPGSIALMNCDPIYYLRGPTIRECQNNGEWTDEDAVCVTPTIGSLECPLLNIINGAVTYSNGTNIGSVAFITCNEQFMLRGPNTRMCQNSGMWTGENPLCQPQAIENHGCPSLNINNGAVSYTDDTNTGSVAIVTCDQNFVLSGPNSRECQDSGAWTGQDPVCRPLTAENVRCPILSIVNGAVTYTDNNNIGSMALFICHEQFVLHGPSSRECESTGVWTEKDPVCVSLTVENTTCPILNIENGAVTYTENTNRGSIAVITCHEQFVLLGPRTRECQNSGAWTGEDPVCQHQTSRSTSCPLLNVANGTVTYTDDTNVGSIAVLMCNEQFVLSGANARECQSSGVWTGNDQACLPQMPETVGCPILSVVNGQVTYTDRTNTGSVAIVACNNLYLLRGPMRRECQDSGMWTGENQMCLRQTTGNPRCPVLSIGNGAVTYTDHTNSGSTAQIICDEQFFLRGPSRRVCQRSGVWTGENSVCISLTQGITTCPILTINNGTVAYTDGANSGSVAIIECNIQFMLRGPKTRECQSRGAWTGEDSVCVPYTSILNILNGAVTYTDNTNSGSVASIVCNRQFVLSGPNTKRCQNNNMLTGSDSVCQPETTGNVNCPVLRITNGAVTYTDGTNTGSFASITCNRLFVLRGQNTRECQSNGVWTGNDPVCQPQGTGNVGCPLLNILNGAVTYTDDTNSGSNAVITCNSQFVLSGPSTRQCQNNNMWTGSDSVCQPQTTGNFSCPKLHIINGDVTYTNGTNTGSVALFTCNRLFVLRGQATRGCQNNGMWTGNHPVCQPQITGVSECPMLNIEDGALVYTDETNIGSIARYICRRHFVLRGQSTRVCQTNGLWTGGDPACSEVTKCPTLSIENGTLMYADDTHVGSVARYTCNNQFELQGRSERVCQTTGLWTGKDPVCRPQTFKATKCSSLNIKNGQVLLSKNYAIGSIASFQCNEGYVLAGEANIFCQGDGHWSAGRTQCCQTPPHVNYALVEVQDMYATYTCQPPSYPEGDSSLTCINGEWEGNFSLVCALNHSCPILRPLKNGYMRLTIYRNHPAIEHFCNPYFILRGDKFRICDDKRWTGSPPDCYRVNASCPRIAINHGYITINRTHGRDLIAEYACNQGYVLRGNIKRYCRDIMGEWSGQHPRCVLDCEPLPNIYNGRIIRHNDVAQFVCIDGYVLKGSPSRTCLKNRTWSWGSPTTCVKGGGYAVSAMDRLSLLLLLTSQLLYITLW